MPQIQGAGTVFAGGPGSTDRVPWWAKIFTGIGGVIKFMLMLDASGFQYESVVDALVAHAGGGQANGTPITTQLARFATVATGADSALLPATSTLFSAGSSSTIASSAAITVVNAGANSMNVFPATGEKINAGAANAAFAVPAGKTANFYITSVGQWHSMLSA